MPWPKTVASYEHAQLELLHKVRAIKDLAVTMVFGQNRRDLAPLSYLWLHVGPYVRVSWTAASPV